MVGIPQWIQYKSCFLTKFKFLSRHSNIVKKKLKQPFHLDKNVFDFSDLKPCNIHFIIESLQKIFSQNVVNFISPSSDQTMNFEALPNLFSSTEEVFNHPFIHMVHAYENQVHSPRDICYVDIQTN